jgi:hypothetical protein
MLPALSLDLVVCCLMLLLFRMRHSAYLAFCNIYGATQMRYPVQIQYCTILRHCKSAHMHWEHSDVRVGRNSKSRGIASRCNSLDRQARRAQGGDNEEAARVPSPRPAIWIRSSYLQNEASAAIHTHAVDGSRLPIQAERVRHRAVGSFCSERPFVYYASQCGAT